MPVKWLSFKRDLVTALEGKSRVMLVEVWLIKVERVYLPAIDILISLSLLQQ